LNEHGHLISSSALESIYKNGALLELIMFCHYLAFHGVSNNSSISNMSTRAHVEMISNQTPTVTADYESISWWLNVTVVPFSNAHG
jgi:hypothetical protein